MLWLFFFFFGFEYFLQILPTGGLGRLKSLPASTRRLGSFDDMVGLATTANY